MADENVKYGEEVILVVDDDESVRVPIAEVLKHLGFEAHTASDGPDALDFLQKNHATFLLTDMKMPDMNGLELIKIVSVEYPGICTIAMTGHSKEYTYIDVVNAGAADFINKPFDIEELEAKVRRAILERDIKNELSRLSITDSLTGLYNQRHFYAKLKEETMRASRQGYSVGLILLDLDGFKQYNDSKGHLAGDKVLQKVGEIIDKNIREGVDSGYRYGGDEFAIILIDAGPDVWQLIVRRIEEAIKDKCHVTASTGFAMYKEGMSPELFVEEADQHLYKFKGKKKNMGLNQ
jgi:diguanylate cyclase (GGDEF)-like protein